MYEARLSAIIGSLYRALGASQNSCPRKLEHVSSLMRKSATRFLDTTRSSGKRDCIVINIRMNSRCTRATVWSYVCIAFLLRKCYCIVDCWSNVFVGIYLRLKLSRDLPSQIELIHLFLSTTRWLKASKKVIESRNRISDWEIGAIQIRWDCRGSFCSEIEERFELHGQKEKKKLRRGLQTKTSNTSS